MDYKIDDTVMYGNCDICKIIDIRTEKFSDTEQLYYVLKPVYDERSTIYCPVDSDLVKLRDLLSKDEVYELIALMPDTETEWIENDQERKLRFNDLLRNGDHKQLVKLLKTLYYNRETKLREGKKFYAVDERVMKEAEKIVHREIAHVLDISLEEVVPFITGQLSL